MDRTCTKCRIAKPLADFSAKNKALGTLQEICRICTKIYMAEWRKNNLERKRQMDRNYAAANREKARQKTRDWTKNNKERKRENDRLYALLNKDKIQTRSVYYRALNHDRVREQKQKYREENREKILENQKAWKKANKGKVLANVALRKMRKKNATPPWLTKEQKRQMREIYETAQTLRENLNEDFHVDHIIPITSPFVCGLHVPWNLQILLAEENIRKSNSLI